MYWVGAGILQGEGAILGTCPRSPGDIRNIQRELKLFAMPSVLDAVGWAAGRASGL